MTSSLISWAASGGEAGGEPAHELPMPPIGYALIALLFFAFFLVLLWSFRNTAAKPGPQRAAKKARH